MAEITAGGGGVMGHLASNDEQRVALQFAFFNTLLFVLLLICFCALFALYNMLYMFLMPMMWAVLVGTVLFPFKKNVTDSLKGWLLHLKETETTLVVGLLTLPFRLFSKVSFGIFDTMTSQDGLIIIGIYGGLKVLLYQRTFMYLINWMGRVYATLDAFIVFFAKPWVFPLICLYFCAYAAWIYVQESGTINKKLARTLSLPIWIYALSFVSLYFGPFRAAAFGICALVLALLSAGVLGVENGNSGKKEENENKLDTAEAELKSEEEKEAAKIDTPPKMSEKSDTSEMESALSGNRLINIIFWLCVILWIARHDSTLVIIAIPLGFALFARMAERIGITSYVSGQASGIWDKLAPNVSKVVHVTVAGPLRQFVKVLFTSDQYIKESLYDKMDVLSSVVVMLLLALSALFALIFVAVQLHGETVHLLRLTSNVVSSRPDWLAVAMNYTEDQLEDHDIDIDTYVQQAYEQGRAWLAAQARALSDGKDPKRADLLEQQVQQVCVFLMIINNTLKFTIVDKIYHLWEERNAASQNASNAIARPDWMTQLKSVTDLGALKEELTLIVKENLDTLMGIAHSLWAIIAVNISFLTSVLASFAGVILGFGMDIINFLIELLVFLTIVYYLLSFSSSRWLPLEWASHLMVNFKSVSSGGSYDVTSAVENAIFGVFILSAKMAVFYGLYTYFVHSLFDLNVVFVPSMLASLFAAIPIMAPYFVSVFGIFELWLVRGESAAALVFALMSFAPFMFADATFYSEVKGSHPYMTGLSIIGGMYWLGLQGAIIGPIILCSFLVLVNVYLEYVTPPSTPEAGASLKKIE